MATRHKFSAEEIEAIKAARKQNRDKYAEKRLQVLELLAEGKKAAEIAEATGFHENSIPRIMKRYRDGGLEAISENNYGGNRRNMTVEEEAEILKPFKERAERGEIIEVGEIEAAYQAKVDHPIGNSQIYFVLKRHNWRKVMPRSRHPKKASEEVIETSKKLKHS